MFKVGPIGSKCSFDKSWDEKGRYMISSIYVAFDKQAIRCIQFSYFRNGRHVVSEKYGSTNGKSSYEIVRLKENEYVTGLSGIDCGGITALRIHTNQRIHGPLCERFSSNLGEWTREIDVKIGDRREFGGFFGSFCEFRGLTSIGIYVNPTYDHKLTLNQTWDPIDAVLTHNYQIPKMVDGIIPVNHIRYKPKLKDRILSKLDFRRAILSLIKAFLD